MRGVALVAALLLAAPVVAQVPGLYGAPEAARPAGNPMLAGMSEAGRAVMRAALRSADEPGAKAATAAARDRWLALLDADRFDPVALRRAMDEEREAANAAKARHQTALIAGLSQLSLADRRIFVANARILRERLEGQAAELRARRAGRMNLGLTPPPPQ